MSTTNIVTDPVHHARDLADHSEEDSPHSTDAVDVAGTKCTGTLHIELLRFSLMSQNL